MSDAGQSEAHSVIEAGTELEGVLESACPVVVNGRLEGELQAPHLEVSATGRVLGTVRAEALSSAGSLSGRIEAGNVTLAGSVGANTVIKARGLQVDLPRDGRRGLALGECTLEVGEEPSKVRRDAPSPRSSLVAPGVSLLPSCAPRATALDQDVVELEGCHDSAPPSP